MLTHAALLHFAAFGQPLLSPLRSVLDFDKLVTLFLGGWGLGLDLAIFMKENKTLFIHFQLNTIFSILYTLREQISKMEFLREWSQFK